MANSSGEPFCVDTTVIAGFTKNIERDQAARAVPVESWRVTKVTVPPTNLFEPPPFDEDPAVALA